MKSEHPFWPYVYVLQCKSALNHVEQKVLLPLPAEGKHMLRLHWLARSAPCLKDPSNRDYYCCLLADCYSHYTRATFPSIVFFWSVGNEDHLYFLLCHLHSSPAIFFSACTRFVTCGLIFRTALFQGFYSVSCRVVKSNVGQEKFMRRGNPLSRALCVVRAVSQSWRQALKRWTPPCSQVTEKSYSDEWPSAFLCTCTQVDLISNLSLIVSVFLSHINNESLTSSWQCAVLLSFEVLCKLTAERKGLAASIDFHLGVALSAHHLQASQSSETCVCACVWCCIIQLLLLTQIFYRHAFRAMCVTES